MTRVLVVGAGLSGCVVALELAAGGVQVTLVEAAAAIGGKVRGYGCKATDRCNNCGLCLVSGLWDKVEGSDGIQLYLSSQLVDLVTEAEQGMGHLYTATLKTPDGAIRLEGFTHVVVATGFKPSASKIGNTSVELAGGIDGIITGSQLEALLLERSSTGIFEIPPESIAFLQCYGSRDCREHAQYCSRVCCGYSTRAAKVIKHYYPACKVVFFYMEIQGVNQGEHYQSLVDAGIEFIKCRPVKIAGQGQESTAIVTYDDPALGKRVSASFDWVVLSEGISPGDKARPLSEICGLGQDDAGFFTGGYFPGVMAVGSATGPMKIEEAYFEAVALAKAVLRVKPAFLLIDEEALI